MDTLLAVVLVCALGQAPGDCTRETALDVLVTPAASPMECARKGQAVAASAGLLGDESRTLKIRCERRKG